MKAWFVGGRGHVWYCVVGDNCLGQAPVFPHLLDLQALETPPLYFERVLKGFLGKRIWDGGMFHRVVSHSKSLDPAWDLSQL